MEEMVWVDLDITGFRAEGKTYEGTTKGYIGEKGARGWMTRAGDAIVLMFTVENPTIRQYIRCGDGPSLLTTFAPNLGHTACCGPKSFISFGMNVRRT